MRIVPSRVLIADDEIVIADTLARILRREGMETLAAYGGHDAAEKLKTFCPDLLLTDVVMPDMSGVDLALLTRRLYPHTNVLLFSGQAGIADLLLKAEQAGHAFELLQKPVSPQEVVARVKHLLLGDGSQDPTDR